MATNTLPWEEAAKAAPAPQQVKPWEIATAALGKEAIANSMKGEPVGQTVSNVPETGIEAAKRVTTDTLQGAGLAPGASKSVGSAVDLALNMLPPAAVGSAVEKIGRGDTAEGAVDLGLEALGPAGDILKYGLSTFVPAFMSVAPDVVKAAAKRLDDGEPPASVWKDTMVGRTPEGQLFTEVSDRGIKKKNKDWWDKVDLGKKQSPVLLSDVIEHPEKDTLAPLLKGLKIETDPKLSSSAAYDRETNIMSIKPTSGMSSMDIVHSVLHEFQHHVT
jgi:hypothetical protein